jgi:hypothetical protein
MFFRISLIFTSKFSSWVNKTTYEDFFPIQPNGIEKVKEILNLLKVEITEE